MGYIKHHAIVFVCQDYSRALKANEIAKSICPKLTSKIIESVVNQYFSFFVAPDGSKEYWTESETGDENRKKIIDRIKKEVPFVDFIEVAFGGNDKDLCEIVNHKGDEENYCQDCKHCTEYNCRYYCELEGTLPPSEIDPDGTCDLWEERC